MKYISFNKYKKYLESLGYIQERGENVYGDLGFRTVFFSKPEVKPKYTVNVFLNSDHVIGINHGYGSPYIGWNSVKVDMRTKFWKHMLND